MMQRIPLSLCSVMMALLPVVPVANMSAHAAEKGALPVAQASQFPADFNGVWHIVGYDEVLKPEDDNPDYTEEALRRIKNFKEHYDEVEDSPHNLCYFVGMPWTMVTRARDYATEIYQSADRVVLFHEGMDLVRHIRLDSKEFPPNYVASAQGWSIAHWENGDLIIETRGLTATNEVSPQHRSEQADIMERWHLIKTPDKPDRIEITLTITDPVIYKKPVHGRQLYERAPAGTLVGGYNCPQSLWDDYVNRIRDERERKGASEGGQKKEQGQ